MANKIQGRHSAARAVTNLSARNYLQKYNYFSKQKNNIRLGRNSLYV